jgi:site-specific recombinase XerD
VVSYLDSRRDEAIPLFISRAQARLAPRTIQASFAVHFRRAGVEGSVQTLRYTFGVHRSQSGVESHELQELMGYRAFASTKVYRTTDPTRLREIARRTEERY